MLSQQLNTTAHYIRPKLPSGSLAVTRLLTRSDYERVNEMTTENTSTEAMPLTPIQIAEEFVKDNTTSTIIEEFVNHYNTIESLKTRVAAEANNAVHYRQLLNRKLEIVEDFLKTHIIDNDSASVDELKELAEELDIDLTREVEVTFHINVTATVTVPIDFDIDDLSDSDFDIRVDYSGNHTDVECDDVEWDTDNFEAEDK